MHFNSSVVAAKDFGRKVLIIQHKLPQLNFRGLPLFIHVCYTGSGARPQTDGKKSVIFYSGKFILLKKDVKRLSCRSLTGMKG